MYVTFPERVNGHSYCAPATYLGTFCNLFFRSLNLLLKYHCISKELFNIIKLLYSTFYIKKTRQAVIKLIFIHLLLTELA